MDEKILEKATELFMKEGFKVVTMDEIASSLGISKKTIYQYYSNKNILVEKSAYALAEKVIADIDSIYSEKLNPIEEMLLVRKKIARYFSDDKTAGVQQLKKYYPEIHLKLRNNQRSKMEVCIRNNIERGIELGLFRDDIDIWFTIKLYHNGMNFIIEDPELFNNLQSFSDYQSKYLDYHIRAIGTQKGIELFNELKNNIDEK